MKRLLVACLIGLPFAGSAAAAPGDMRFCGDYANNAAAAARNAIRQNPACLDWSKGVHDNVKMHFDWCMRMPRPTVVGALDNIRRLAGQCVAAVRPPPPAPGFGKPGMGFGRPPAPGPCGGVAGVYNGGASTITVFGGNRVRVTVGPNRPAGTGTCQGNRLTIDFPDDHVISGVFNGRTISWDNRTTWTKN